MKKIFTGLMTISILLIGSLSFAGIDYIDYRQEELDQRHQNSNYWNQQKEKDRDWDREREREKNYQHQNREVRDKTIQTIDRVNSYPERFIP